MTQPIQEPTADRALQGLAFARDQIFRRPAPSGCPCEIPWIVLKDIDVGQEFTADSTTTVVYQEVCNDYPEVFDAVIFSGSDYYAVEILQDGLYSIHLSIPLDELNVAEHTLQLVNVDPSGGPQFHRETFMAEQSATGPATSGADAAEWTVRLATGQEIWWLVNNTDPAVAFNSRDDGGSYLEVRQLGTSTMGGRTRDVPCSS